MGSDIERRASQKQNWDGPGDKNGDALDGESNGEPVEDLPDVPFRSMIFGPARIGPAKVMKPKGRRGQRREIPAAEPERPASPGEPHLTTTEAAIYCRFLTPGGLRKAWYQLLVFPVGRRGGRGTLMWRRAELDRFLRGAPLLQSEAAGVMMPPHLQADGAAEKMKSV